MLATPTVFSGAKYIQIFTDQVYAMMENERARSRFIADSANWTARNVVARDREDPYGAAAGDPEPKPPLMKIVADDGTVSTAAFPDLTTPVLPPQNKIVRGGGAFFGGATLAPPEDRIDKLAARMVESFAALSEQIAQLKKA